MNNITKTRKERKKKHDNLVKFLEPRYMNNKSGFIVEARMFACFVYEPT